MADNYGAQWLRSAGVKEISPFGERVADLLNKLFTGIYHIDRAACKADYSSESWITVCVSDQYFSTFDFSHLTLLVLLCHDFCIRCEMRAAARGFIRLCFSPREREGDISHRHPTMEEHIEYLRGGK